jgi:hypothetical protein
VQLHVIEELWDLLSDTDAVDDQSKSEASSDETGHLCLCLSEAAITGVESSRSMRLVGTLQGFDIVILVDSGSSHSFLSSSLAPKLEGGSALPSPLQVKVANGAKVQCNVQFSQAAWSVQGYQFFTNFKVLPLQHYDVILGYEWLEPFSPMKVHWGAKWMMIPYGSKSVVLQGIVSALVPGDKVQLYQLSVPMEQDSDIDQMLLSKSVIPEVQQLLLGL